VRLRIGIGSVEQAPKAQAYEQTADHRAGWRSQW